jgi:hypothetical protein
MLETVDGIAAIHQFLSAASEKYLPALERN